MAQLAGLRVYPIKGLDGTTVEQTTVLDGGTLSYDREFKLVDESGELVNGKRTARVHDLDTAFDLSRRQVTVTPPDGHAQTFDLVDEGERAERWFSEFFGHEVRLRRTSETGFVDRPEMGPSVISTATLQTVASWFEAMTVSSARRRLRANVEISGVPSFWEDRFVGTDAPSFSIGDARFEGVTPCGRCVVPGRDPDTGEPTPEFRERFLEKRRETFPEWADWDAFEHYFTLMILTSVPDDDRGETLRIGDAVTVHDDR